MRVSQNHVASPTVRHRTLPGLIASLLLMLPAVMGYPTSESHAALDNDKPIKIGFITSLTGVAAPGGRDMVKGLKLWLEQCHHKVAGFPIEVIIENDESSAATAITKMHKLVDQDKVQMISGLLLAQIAHAAMIESNKLEIPCLAVLGGGDDLIPKVKHPFYMHSLPSPYQQTFPFGDWAITGLGYKRVAIFAMDYPFGYEVAGSFQKSFEDAGGKVIQKIWAPLGFTDFSSYIQQIDKSADAVFVVTTSNAARIFAQQYAEKGPNLPVLGTASSVDESILADLPRVPLGATSYTFYSAKIASPANRRFVSAYKAQNGGSEPGMFAAATYDTGMIIEKVIESLHGDLSARSKVLSAIKNVDLPELPTGSLKFDEQGQPTASVYACKLEKVGSKLQNTVIHTFSDVGPYWRYKPADLADMQTFTRTIPPCKYCTK